MATKVYGEIVSINFAHPMCRCNLGPDKPYFSWSAKIGNISFNSKTKAVNVVKRLAARAIIYTSINQ